MSNLQTDIPKFSPDVTSRSLGRSVVIKLKNQLTICYRNGIKLSAAAFGQFEGKKGKKTVALASAVIMVKNHDKNFMI